MPKIIQQIKKIEGIEVTTEHIFKTVNCTIYAVSKMHEIINRGLSDRAIKLFQMLHFDLTINNTDFDRINCITYFIDEFIFYNWVFVLINHKKTTLIPVFKALINQCDRVGLAIQLTIILIRIGQEISIENALKK